MMPIDPPILDQTIRSAQVQEYLQALKAVTPLGVKLFGKGNFSRLVIGEHDFVDSTIPWAQKPALYAALDVLNGNKNASILYAASSWGLGMAMIKAAGYVNIQGIDIDEKAVEFSRAQGLDAKVMDAARTTFPDDTFDLIVSRDFVSWNYLPEQKCLEVVNEQFRLLKPGGYAVFTTMRFKSPANFPTPKMLTDSAFPKSLMKPREFLLLSKGLDAFWDGPTQSYMMLYCQKKPS